jgi:uncharacterized membrane protein
MTSAAGRIASFPLPRAAAGSVVDSALGQTLQRTWQERKSGKITSRLPDPRGDAGKQGFAVVCGSDVLSNEAVNMLSALITMGAAAWTAAAGHAMAAQQRGA